MDDFVAYPEVERVLGHGDTKSSILIRGGFQADLRLVAADSRGAALQYFTGSKPHNIALRDRAIGLGFKLNEYGLFRIADDTKVAGEREEDIYAALGLEWVAPELRELRGEIEAAESNTLPHLIDRADLRGDLHTHTTESDGKDELRAMADAARDAGLEYIAITDHSQSLAMANGLDERRALAHAARVRALDAEGIGIRLLAGIECDIRSDGSMDLADDCLAALDIVVASVHSGFNQDRAEMTDRILKALDQPARRYPGPPHRQKAPEAAALSGRHGSDRRRGGPARGGDRDQLSGESPGRQRRARQAGARPGRAAGDFERRAFQGCLRAAAMGRHRRAARVAGTGACAEHAAVRDSSRRGSLRQTPVKLPMLSADDKLAEIRRLYFKTTRQTIQEDLARALDLLKSMHSEEERERATVYMEGLAQMRSDWSRGQKGKRQKGKGKSKKEL